ncbi:sporulation protein YqfD [Dysosmobacter sp.]
MLRKIVNRFQGQVRVRVEAAFPERVLNLCGARNLSFWDLEWEGPTAFTCRLSRRDWHSLRRAAKHLDCTLTPVGREGVPYFVGRFRKRYALLLGLGLCAAALSVGSFFIWDFTVEGNETVTTEEILRALQKNGVEIGTFGFSLDAEDLRNHVLLDIPELSWMTVNVSGCRAYVQVRERVMAPELVNKRAPTNVVARRAGLVLKVRALDGVTCALPGTAVEEGQLLISGVEDTETFGARILAGMGTVQARTWYTLTVPMALTAPVKQYTGEERTYLSLIFGTRRVKFFSNSSIEGREYDKITKRHPWTLFGLPLPVTAVTETCRFYEPAQTAVETQAAKAAGEAILTAYLHTLVDDYGQVTSSLCTARQKGDVLLVTLLAECREQIGQTVPIYTENTDG